MGGSFSVKRDSIYISLSAPSYSAGEWVEGNVLLNIVEQKPATSVDIAITGREFASITDRVRDQSLASEHPKTLLQNLQNDTENCFLQVSYPLLTLTNEVVEAGQFTIPFKFQLPNQLPQSFSASGPGWHANVTYKLKVKLTGSAGQARYFHKAASQEINCEKELVVDANLGHRPELLRPVTQNLDDDIVTFCCCPSGILRQSISLNKSAYTPGETVYIDASIENNSRTNISSVSVHLSRVITLRIQGAVHVFRENLHSQEYPGFPASTRLIGNNSVKIPFALPKNIPPDTSGSVITCTTTIEFIAFPEGCFSSPIKCRQPVLLLSNALFSPEERDYVESQTYPGWTPTVIDTVSLGSVPWRGQDRSLASDSTDHYQSASSYSTVLSAPTFSSTSFADHQRTQAVATGTEPPTYQNSVLEQESHTYTHTGKF